MRPLITPKIVLQYKASLQSFHDRSKHAGMTYEDFWDLYLAWIGKNTIHRYRNVPQFIRDHEQSALYLLTQMFRKTLHLRENPSGIQLPRE